jgi:YD repeat-containing protein
MQTTSPYGAVTTTPYSTTGPQIVATTNGRWVKTYLDGLGHVAKVERGDSGGLKSVQEAVYDVVGCSPVESALSVSVPHVSGATPAWQTNSYDALGRTVRKVRPDGASTYTYSYVGNTVTATDPAGKWKKFTVDAFGKLIEVVEPTPNPSSEPDHVTLYSYDLLGKLAQARMDRTVAGAIVSQYRTWVYDSVTERLVSKTAPETGTTSYTYNNDGTVATVTDAKNQRKVFTYDPLGRVTYIARGNVVGGSFVEDVSQHTTFAYDGTNGGFSQNTLGRVSTISYTGPHGMSINEYYSYHSAGAVTAKDLSVVGLWGTSGAHLIANYGYDNEGRVTSIQYPVSQWNSPNATIAGPTYRYGYDSMGRLTTMVDQANNVLVSGASYGPADELLGLIPARLAKRDLTTPIWNWSSWSPGQMCT